MAHPGKMVARFWVQRARSLIAASQTGNLDLAAAESRALQAASSPRQSGATLLPIVAVGADADKSFLGANYGFDF